MGPTAGAFNKEKECKIKKTIPMGMILSSSNIHPKRRKKDRDKEETKHKVKTSTY